MASLDASAATDPTAVAQQVAAAQSAELEEQRHVAQHEPPQPDTVSAVQTGIIGTLEVDTNPERDGAYGDGIESYHAYQEGKYLLPNDDKEIERLELQHRIWQLAFSDRLNLAPVPSSVKTALDIGCGTGIWAIEFAEKHPHCRVTGTDLSPIQPTIVPPNVNFIVDDITAPWMYPHKFDYIHSRAITVGIKDWSVLVNECWQNLEPGGWVEFQEYRFPFQSIDGTMETGGPAFSQFCRDLGEATTKIGTRLDAIVGVRRLLGPKGFENVENAITNVPVGPWAKGEREKKIGLLFETDVIRGVEAAGLRLYTKLLGWSEEDTRVFFKEVEADIRSRKMHVYMSMDTLWAQKPLNAVD